MARGEKNGWILALLPEHLPYASNACSSGHSRLSYSRRPPEMSVTFADAGAVAMRMRPPFAKKTEKRPGGQADVLTKGAQEGVCENRFVHRGGAAPQGHLRAVELSPTLRRQARCNQASPRETARAERREDLVRAKVDAGSKGHRSPPIKCSSVSF